MADNITLPGTNSVVATDDISSVEYQRIKLIHGADGTNDGDVSSANPLPVVDASTGVQRLPFFRFLDLNGDGTGTKNAIGDYSTPDIFYIQPAAGVVYRVARMIVSIEDGGGMRAERYASLGAALSTGVQVRVQNDSGTVIDLTNGIPITSNALWGSACYDVDVKSWGAGNDILLVRWTFERAGQMLRLDGDANERLEVVLSDDFTGVVGHYFMAQGYDETVST